MRFRQLRTSFVPYILKCVGSGFIRGAPRACGFVHVGANIQSKASIAPPKKAKKIMEDFVAILESSTQKHCTSAWQNSAGLCYDHEFRAAFPLPKHLHESNR